MTLFLGPLKVGLLVGGRKVYVENVDVLFLGASKITITALKGTNFLKI